jgi:CRISPR-associated protein Csm3
MEMVIREFEGDDVNKTQRIVLEALSLVQKEYLGGSGSRGYGKVSFQGVSLGGMPIAIE